MVRWGISLSSMRSLSTLDRPHRVLDAYRAAAVRSAVALDDGTWAQVGTLLEHAALLAPDERGAHVHLATNTIRGAIGDVVWRAGHPTDPHAPSDQERLEGRLRVYCEVIEDAGAFEVADAIVAAYVAADVTIQPLERARVESVRARLAWKRGDLDIASERYHRVAADARRLRSDELQVRAWTGDAIVARLRGNFPESRAKGQHAVALAERAGLQRLASVAHQSLMVADAVAGAFAAAIDHAWRAFLCAQGDESMESAALGNVGQVFLDAGHPATATSAFRAVIRRQPSTRILLPALGGLAVAAARLKATDALDEARREIAVRMSAGAAPYDTATAMLDLARAYTAMHDQKRAKVFLRHAKDIARKHGFHEIGHHADALQRAPVRFPTVEQTLSPQTDRVAGALRVLAGV